MADSVADNPKECRAVDAFDVLAGDRPRSVVFTNVRPLRALDAALMLETFHGVIRAKADLRAKFDA